MTAPLPRLLVVTDGKLTCGRPLAEVVASAIAGGARAVWLRDKHLSVPERDDLAGALAGLLGPVGGLLLASPVGGRVPPGVDGIHLAARDAQPDARLGTRPDPRHEAASDAGGRPHPGRGTRGFILGRSCHSAGDVTRAADEGCDYVTLSPIFVSPSKPGYGPALGPGALAASAVPAWGLGGIDAGNAVSCLEAGGSGVAVMGAIMGAGDPAGAVATILAALERA